MPYATGRLPQPKTAPPPPPLGPLVRSRRLELHLTLAELSARAGIGVATIQRIETGAPTHPPSARVIHALAAALGLPVNDLFDAAVADWKGESNV